MGSTPTGASFFSRSLTAVALATAMTAGIAFGQPPAVPLLTPYTPGPGAAAPGYIGSDMLPPATPGGGETTRYHTEEQMKGYFDGRVADEFIDNCTWEDRVCYGYFAIDGLFWDRVRSAGSTMAIRTSTGAVLFNGKNFIWNDLEAVPRLTAGYVFDNGYALEGTYFYKDDLGTSAGVELAGDINFSAFGPPSAVFAPNFLQADRIGAWTAVSMQGAEAHIVQTNEFFNFLVGFRWIELHDRLAITTYKGGVPSGANFETYNKLLGGQVGMKLHHQSGFFSFDGFAKMGMYLNAGQSHTTIVNAGAGLPDQTRTAEGNSEAFIAEGQVSASYSPYIWLHTKIGWQAIIIQQTALAVDQPLSSNQTGFTLEERGDIIYHGPFAGVEFHW